MSESIRIGNKMVGEKYPAYIIAEVGLNHQGDLALAKKLVDEAVAAGADCVKFQKRSLKNLYKHDVLEHPENQEHALQYLLDHIVKCELSEVEMIELYQYTISKGVDFMCTPWDRQSLDFLSALNMPAYKIGSPDLFNLPLIREVAKLKKPLIVSTGMSFISEIDQVIDFLNDHNAQYILLHCNSTYPTPLEDINLRFLKPLSEKTKYPVGFSGHEPGIQVALAAVVLGSKVVEKHITLDRSLPGPDHRASLLPNEFKELVSQIRQLETALGEPVRYPSRGEFLNRENLSKSLVVTRDLKVGDTLRYEDIDVMSPGHGTKPLKLDYFVGRKLIQRNLKKEDYLLESDVDVYNPADLTGMDIKHNWGIVVRMTDAEELIAKNKPRFVEVHLTGNDINLDILAKKSFDLPLVIHGPEYDGELLLDLSSQDENIRQQTVAFFNKAFVHARKVKQLFTNRNEAVKFIIHPGGMSMERPMPEKISVLNENLLRSLKELNTEGFEPLIENMPPRPWYFGGQWYHSSLMNPEEIVEFSRRSGYGVCFDTSHAGLYCNWSQTSIIDFAKIILPVTRYIQVADAAKFNGEGLKIGDGNVDFKNLLPLLVKTDLWFLPEIWQGHKFGGEDFIMAIKQLKLMNPDF